MIRTTLVILFSVLLPLNLVQAKNIRLAGTVTCLEHGDKDHRRTAKYILLLPEGMPHSADLSNEYGYYELLTDPASVEDRNVEIIYIDNEGKLQPGPKRYISWADLWGESVLQFESIENKTNCNNIEKPWDAQNQRLSLIKKQPPEKFQIIPSAITITGVGVLVAGLVAKTESINSNNKVITILPFDAITSSALYKKSFIDLAWAESSQNIGFNFTPLRNQNEAAFWNPSSIMFSFKDQVSILTNFGDRSMATMNYKIDSLGFSVGILGFHKSETRAALYGTEIVRGKIGEDNYMATASLSKLVSNKIAFALSINYLSQYIEKPIAIKQVTDVATAKVSKSLYLKKNTNKNYDFNISSTFLLGQKIIVGISIINALDSKLHYEDGNSVGLRNIGVGIKYQSGRVNVGAEVKSREGQKIDTALGVNYVPYNDVLIFAGASNAFDARSVGVSYKMLSYSYNRSTSDSGNHLISAKFSF